ncbi:transmembrane protein 14C [Spinellus fusiger]|nr:transmembrane protein 14C [Spinellus fusiger]
MEYFGYVYGTLVAVGGLIGYVKAGSQISLLSGLVLGTGISVGAYKASYGSIGLGLASNLILLAVMANRYRKTGKFMPAGLIALTSTSMAIYYGRG